MASDHGQPVSEALDSVTPGLQRAIRGYRNRRMDLDEMWDLAMAKATDSDNLP
ncbi:MAG: hypothetical protein OEW83_17990 [Acidimicrobiia bacterium]|nr:hypothetical protein [Acidimicrobiia bacterium]